MELIQTILEKDQELSTISGEVESTGMGKWTLQEALKHNIPTPVITTSVEVRQESKKTGGNYGTKIVALLYH